MNRNVVLVAYFNVGDFDSSVRRINKDGFVPLLDCLWRAPECRIEIPTIAQHGVIDRVGGNIQLSR